MSLLLNNLKSLFTEAADSSAISLASSPFFSKSRAHAAAAKVGLDKVKASLNFDLINQNSDFLKVRDPSTNQERQDLSFLEEATEAGPTRDKARSHNVSVAINWLQEMVRTLIQKVNEHGQILKFSQQLTDSKADQADVEAIKTKNEALEKELDECRQRGMKGNIILSSPDHGRAVNMLKHTNIQVNDTIRLEHDHEMCIRVIREKTGVQLHTSDVIACHALPTKGNNTSFILRVGNMRQGSNWETLAAGMLTGKNKETGRYFNKDYNLYLSFQLTNKRSTLLKAVKEKRKVKVVERYGVDQNGKVTILLRGASRFVVVNDISHLEQLCSCVRLTGDRYESISSNRYPRQNQ